MSDALQPYGLEPYGSSVLGILQARIFLSGLPCPLPGDLSNPGIELVSPASPALQVESLQLSPWGTPKRPDKAQNYQPSLIWSHKEIRRQELFFSAKRWDEYLWRPLPVTYQAPSIPEIISGKFRVLELVQMCDLVSAIKLIDTYLFKQFEIWQGKSIMGFHFIIQCQCYKYS